MTVGNTTIDATVTPPTLVAEASILIDGDTGQILYEMNAHRTLPPASITKLMTALLTIEALEPDETITFSRNAVMSIERGSSHIGMREGETITVNDALHGLLLMSANEVANGLAEAVSGSVEDFATDMNEKTAALGGLNTNFLNPHGLYDVSHYTTAYDMALITKELLRYDYFLEVMANYTYQIPATNLVDETRYLSQSHKILNPNKGTKHYREDAIAGKSGFTTKSGYTLVTVAEQEGRRLIAVTLNTDANNLYTDTHKLLDYGFDSFHTAHIESDAFTIEKPFSGNQGGSALLTLAEPVSVHLPEGTIKETIIYQADLPDTVVPSIDIGDTVGHVTLKQNDRDLVTLKLMVASITEPAQDLIEVNATEEIGDVALPEAESKPPSNRLRIPLLILLALSIIGGCLFLFSKHRSSAKSYSDYKRMRDQERGQ